MEVKTMNNIFDDFSHLYGIYSQITDSYELAWQIKDYAILLEFLYDKKRVVLGGDILNSEQNHTYDNWYYNYDSDIPLWNNVENSIFVADNYLSNYIKNYGENFYVIFVVR